MSSRDQQMSREELVEALAASWGEYLPTVAQLSEEERAQYVHAQGYPRVQDLLAHVIAWWKEVLDIALAIQDGQSVPSYDEDAFNAQAVAKYQDWPTAKVEAEFERLRAAVADFILGLPEPVFEQERMYRLVFIATVGHYEEHQPPNASFPRQAASAQG